MTVGFAILLNIIWPGAGRIYAGDVILGFLEMLAWPVFLFVGGLATGGLIILLAYPFIVVDGYLAGKKKALTGGQA